MDGSLIALAAGAAIIILEIALHRSAGARKIFAKLAAMVPRRLIWTVFLASAGTAAHLASWWAMLALAVAIGTFAFAMAAWLAAADRAP